MDRLFPPDEVSVVFWAAPAGFDGPTTFRIQMEREGEASFDEAFAVEFLDGKDRHFFGEVELIPGQHVITVDVTRDSTDITAGESRDIVCQATGNFSAGLAFAITVVPSHPLCWWPTQPQWRQLNGDPVTPDYIHEVPHCEQAGFMWLIVGDARTDADAYARQAALVTRLDHLPTDAIDSGPHRAGYELWFTPDGDKAYIRSVSGVEELPRMTRSYCY